MKLSKLALGQKEGVPFVRPAALCESSVVFDIVKAEQGTKPDFFNPRQMNVVYAFTIVRQDGLCEKFEVRDSDYWAEAYAQIKTVTEGDDRVEDCIMVSRTFVPKGRTESITFYRLAEAPDTAIARMKQEHAVVVDNLRETSLDEHPF